MTSNKRILVIGAGACGLTSVKACIEDGLDVVCYEKTGNFGGLWHYHDEDVEGVPSLMKSTISNTSKEMSSFSDFPAPSHFPIYMPHSHVLIYLQLYAEHFDVLSRIKYFEEVIEVKLSDDYKSNGGAWHIKVKNTKSSEIRKETFDGVMVCSGCYSYPFTPSYPGQESFTGVVVHSHSYKTFVGLEGKTVLVVGTGNSGTDIAVELANVCNKVYLSSRRGTWFFPRTGKTLKPLDVEFTRRSNAWTPASIRERKAKESSVDLKKLGMRPQHSISSQHPTVNDDLKARLASGTIALKRDVVAFTDFGAQFDGETEIFNIDVVIFATGYQHRFPFLEEDIFRSSEKSEVSLYKGIFPPYLEHPTLAIMGLIQPNGSSFLVAEMQARFFTSVLNGKLKLPNETTMMLSIKKDLELRRKSYVPSPRHAVERDIMTYLDDLAGEVGVKPKLSAMFFADHKLFRACFFGPLLGYQYRLNGPHSWLGARNAILTYKDRLYGTEKAEDLLNKT